MAPDGIENGTALATKPPSKSAAVRAAWAQGHNDTPTIADFCRRTYGLEITSTDVSNARTSDRLKAERLKMGTKIKKKRGKTAPVREALAPNLTQPVPTQPTPSDLLLTPPGPRPDCYATFNARGDREFVAFSYILARMIYQLGIKRANTIYEQTASRCKDVALFVLDR